MTDQRQFDASANAANRRIRIHALAKEILRNGPSLMTMAEAMERARALYVKGVR